jgi:hypothetical protein
MEKLHTSILIQAPRAKVWEVMLQDPTYSDWTTAFGGPSRFEGSWNEGSKILFLSTDPETGDQMGMVSRIKENREHEFVSIQHLGIVKNGVEDTESEAAKEWAPAHENYTFTEVEGGTNLVVELDIKGEYKEVFEEMWAKALLRLKELCEIA